MSTPPEQLKLVVTDGRPKTKRTTFPQRKAVSTPHEQRVADRLTKDGWSVDSTGIETFRSEITEALGRTESPLRWMPDFIAVRGLDVVYIDAKAAMESGPANYERRRRFVNRDCVRYQMTLHALGLLPIYYVFDGFEVSTPHDVFERGKLEGHSPVGSGGAYYAINAEYCRSFDQTFGASRLRQALRAVA
jgi:hypothetical protein